MKLPFRLNTPFIVVCGSDCFNWWSHSGTDCGFLGWLRWCMGPVSFRREFVQGKGPISFHGKCPISFSREGLHTCINQGEGSHRRSGNFHLGKFSCFKFALILFLPSGKVATTFYGVYVKLRAYAHEVSGQEQCKKLRLGERQGGRPWQESLPIRTPPLLPFWGVASSSMFIAVHKTAFTRVHTLIVHCRKFLCV